MPQIKKTKKLTAEEQFWNEVKEQSKW
jgi:hypothetical protein